MKMTPKHGLRFWNHTLVLIALGVSFVINPHRARGQAVPVDEGDTICVVGGALAEGLQWAPLWEVLLQARFTEAKLKVRYLGRSGDTVFSQPREKGEPSLDETLTSLEADIIIAFFGQAEAAAGQAGLKNFEDGLQKWVKHTLSQTYNGKKPPTLIIVSPPPFEATGDASLGKQMVERNVSLQLYTPAMEKVALENSAAFVNANSALTNAFLGSGSKKFTTDGVHLSRAGYKLLGGHVDFQSFGRHPNNDMTGDEARQMMVAIHERNWMFWQRYRLAESRFAYGDASKKTFSGKTNAEILAQEIKAIDALTDSRDKQIWAFSQRRRVTGPPDDSKVPKLLEIPSTAPDTTIHSADEVLKTFGVLDGYEINLVASEKEFPELQNPTGIAFDANGKLLVAVAPSYPQVTPGQRPNDKILAIDGLDENGKAKAVSVFSDGLYLPTGIAAAPGGGVYAAQAGYLSLVLDTNDDGKPEIQHLLGGLGTGVRGIACGPGGNIYLSQGPGSQSSVESTEATAHLSDGGILHYQPTSGRVIALISYPFFSAPSITLDATGQCFASGNASEGALFMTPASGFLQAPDKHPKLQPLRSLAKGNSTGVTFVSPGQWPEETHGNLIVSVGKHLSMLKLAEEDSGYKTEEAKRLLKSSDPSFLPVDLKFGPDGALYIADFCDPLRSSGGLTEHSFRDPKRDRTHGRIWRVVAKSAAGDASNVEALLANLKSPNDAIRAGSRTALAGKKKDAITESLTKWIAELDKASPQYDLWLLEALFLQQQMGTIEESLLKQVLAAKTPAARVAAVRILRWNQDAVAGDSADDLLLTAAGDDHPRVRLESIVAVTSIQKAPGANVALEAGRKATDKFLDYAVKETLRFLRATEKKTSDGAEPGVKSSKVPPRGYSVPLIDLDQKSEFQVLVDREDGQYLGHPTTVLLEDKKTMLCVYPKGHGRGGIVYKRSSDAGKTWSDRLPTPESWATSKEVPTLHQVIGPDGKKRIIMFSGLYPTRMAVTEDDGKTWGELKPVGDWGGIVVMGNVVELKTGKGHYMAMFHDDGRFFAKNGKRAAPVVFKLLTTFSTDGGLTWSFPKAIWSGSDVHLCEPGAIRSPNGKQVAVLLRENSRTKNSYVIFTNDEGKSWTEPRELPGALTGDRHTGQYGPDGRLFISFRDMAHESKTKGDWVGWVGKYEDIVNGTEGQYRVRLKDNHKASDCAYPGVEILPDGTLVTTTYGHWTKDKSPYILCMRFKLEDLDALAK